MKYILITILFLTLNSCSANELPGFRFDNFKETEAYDLAIAVKNDNTLEISKIINKNNKLLEFKDPYYNMTLLSLSIVNQKKDSFIKLLQLGANPNMISGFDNDCTPFTNAIEYSKDCDLFFIENLLKYKADVNKTINYSSNGFEKKNTPLFLAIDTYDENANFCSEMIYLFDNYSLNLLNYSNETIIFNCLFSKNMKALRFFIIEKKIEIPRLIDTNGLSIENQKKYSLIEILNLDEYKFDFYKENEIAKKDILIYLLKNK
jgi:hypothetical protein